jgi:Na+/alanine symporter
VVFRTRPDYLVNETQKARIASILAASQIVAMLLLLLSLLALTVFMALPSGLPSIVRSSSDRIPLMLFLFFLFCLLINFFTNLYNCFALRPYLRLLPRAVERITLTDRLRGSVPYSSVMIMILMFVICLFGIFEGIRLMLTDSVYWSASLAAVVWAGIYIAAVLWIGLKDRFNG